MKYWRASRAGNERAERAKLRAKAQFGSLGSLVNEPIFGIFLRAERARTLARLVRDFPFAARPAWLDANPGRISSEQSKRPSRFVLISSDGRKTIHLTRYSIFIDYGTITHVSHKKR